MTGAEAGALIALIGAIQTMAGSGAFLADQPTTRTYEYAVDTTLIKTGVLLMLVGLVIWVISHLQWVG